MPNLMFILTIAGVSLVALVVIGLILTRMYQRASKERAFVRTGVGGQKVVINGGTLVLPVLHEIIHINMNTLKLSVEKKDSEALITKDKMRIDVTADFYLRVKPDSEAIANAAQTLGRKTMNPNELKTLLEGKFVDALRSVAAEMNMDELYEKRADFVQRVQQAVAEDLLKNGMELETVSLTSLDQTDMKFFNPENAFDAEGLTKLTEIVQSRKKLRNDIEQTTQIQIKAKNLEAERQRLDIEKQEKILQATQKQEVEVQAAERAAETEKQKAEQDRIAKEARIESERSVNVAQIAADRKVQEEKITNDQAVESAKINKEKTIELANQERNIAISQKSEEQSKAKASANSALAAAAAAEEKVITARETEVAERQKTIAVINAEKVAEQNAVELKVKAKANKEAAIDEADAIKTKAQAEADAIKIKAEADQKRYEVDAAGSLALNEAENKLSQDIINMRVKIETITHLSAIIEASVKPISAIDGIKVINVEGLTGSAPATTVVNGETVTTGGNITDQLINGLLKYRTQAPVVDAILKDIGLSGESLQGLTKIVKETVAPNTSKPEVTQQKKPEVSILPVSEKEVTKNSEVKDAPKANASNAKKN